MKKILFAFFILSCNSFVKGQSVSISAIPSPADSSAILDIKSTSKGLLFPRMTSSQRIAIKNPSQGLVLFDTDLKVLFLYDSIKWTPLNQSPIATVEITVKDGNSCTPSNTSLAPASGATISIYATAADITNNTPQYTAITDQNGIAKIIVVDSAINNPYNPYWLIVQKGNAKNIHNGYLIAGIFQSQAEINSSPQQTPTPVVCGPKYADLNMDGKIDSTDFTNSDYLARHKTVIIYQ